MIPLNNRLKTVARYIQHERLADIGSDHAYLPLYALENNLIRFAVAGEVVAGPFEAAVQNVKKYNASSSIDVRLGNGLEVIKPGEVDVITICGMGGPLIADIITTGKDKLSNHPRLVLQSNIHTEAVRHALVSLGYEIIAEEIMKEKKHTYEIIVAEYTTENVEYTQKALKFGPILLQNINEVFIEKWDREYQHLIKVLSAIEHDPVHAQKYEQIKEEISLLKEVLGYVD
ncbi:tRNA (adenine-N(1))-methyltransferase [Macrococcoides goetzii]|nr:tRNA (adenine(22)-N(1))-methyltransferase TrmK [Macrococcus goetzii]TDM42584.1 tRNA (adenine-N(1))-methyltransferase [Macrococcus goetzii]TDM46434.1 tRNA (adenine-N(1))-methyltransferase [Macrococcus goetzii]TDM49920.1 tRNA (adenine-N(1))-methyltransferase [Macrococcus goetzii]